LLRGSCPAMSVPGVPSKRIPFRQTFPDPRGVEQPLGAAQEAVATSGILSISSAGHARSLGAAGGGGEIRPLVLNKRTNQFLGEVWVHAATCAAVRRPSATVVTVSASKEI
jgi:hypothetical protein